MITVLTLWLAIGIPSLVIGLYCLSRIDPGHLIDRAGDRLLIAIWLGLLAISVTPSKNRTTRR